MPNPMHNSGETVCSSDISDISFVFCPTHGGFAAKLVFDDDPHLEDIQPRKHPKNTYRAIIASSRLLIEICRVRDHWENGGAGDSWYQELVGRIAALK